MIESEAISLPQHLTIRLSRPLERLATVAAVLVLFTSSFDIFLVINAGGNYRLCQIILVPLIAIAFVKALCGRTIPVLSSVSVSIWFVFQVAFIPATDFWPKSLGYCLWLLLNLAMMFAFVQIFSEDLPAIRKLLRSYIYSFVFVAVFGILQLLTAVFGLPGILITQWWIPGVLPRINGFSYEPSYFASYLLIGFVFVGSLKRARSDLLPPKRLLGVYWLIALGILISSSRIGIAFLLLEIFLSQTKPWLHFWRNIRVGRIVRTRFRALIPSLLVVGFMLGLSLGVITLLKNSPALAIIFLNGTGISDTNAHSIVERENAFEETIHVIVQHPIIGRSLGGVSSAIAENEGNAIHSFEEGKSFEGMSVFAEVLAASGIIGFIPFLCFLVRTIRKPLKLARIVPSFYSSLLRALVRSLIFAWAVLQFNQNVLRTYLWVHLAVLAAVYAAGLRAVEFDSPRFNMHLTATSKSESDNQ